MFGRKNKAMAGMPVSAPMPVPMPVPAQQASALPPARTAGPGSVGKRAYEARRAEKAGLPLDKWMAQKERRVEAERKAGQAAAEQARREAAPGKSGLLRRLLDRAHRPI